ncbi:hypothetical protein GWI33_013884 [Rhynchophorus ferrugineus]|uniref:Uncharacterized protein n=1 Tax=Rhynchophorus ferrugineus TaxID=354439 RepID=A0A834M9J7_RHYFE|nr:hypothetical protein GWI33_013884 [Rhynchophorus ferrugineus]
MPARATDPKQIETRASWVDHARPTARDIDRGGGDDVGRGGDGVNRPHRDSFGNGNASRPPATYVPVFYCY